MKVPNLDIISFIGIDEKTDLAKIVALYEYCANAYELGLCDFCPEFGILYSLKNAGKANRYPSLDFIEKTVKSFSYYMVPFSIHLCGKEAINEFFDDKNSLIREAHYKHQIERIQLNLNLKDYNEEDLLNKILLKLDSCYPIVLQQNKSKDAFNQKVIQKIPTTKWQYLNILHDASGGRGTVIDDIENPLIDFYTGYAGGFTPENVFDIVEKIENRNVMNIRYYIDMESGIRTNDWLDINKLISIVKQFMD